MANIKFIAESADPQKGFRIGKTPSVLTGGVEFQINGYELGRYSGTTQDSNSQSILLKTSVNESVNLNRFLNSDRVFLDEDGKAFRAQLCSFAPQLLEVLNAIGRRADDDSYLVGSAEDVAKKVVAFFAGKTIVCEDVNGVFLRDRNGKLYSPRVVKFSLK